MIHILKIKEKYYDQVISGRKTFEVRKNDRNYQVGDRIMFNPVKENGKKIISKPNKEVFEIDYILDLNEIVDAKDYVVFSIKRIG